MVKEAKSTSLRLTPEAKRLLKLLAQKTGVSMAAIIEIAIREKAKREEVV
jgi:predicted DNA-binding protein